MPAKKLSCAYPRCTETETQFKPYDFARIDTCLYSNIPHDFHSHCVAHFIVEEDGLYCPQCGGDLTLWAIKEEAFLRYHTVDTRKLETYLTCFKSWTFFPTPPQIRKEILYYAEINQGLPPDPIFF